MNIDKKIIGIICIILAQISFTTQDMAIKFISGNYALHQIVFTRSVTAIIFTLIIFGYRNGGFSFILTNRLGLHLLRGFGIVIANLCFFTSLVTISLAESVSIFFIAPLLITALSVLLIGEKVELRCWAAVLAGLAGVLIIMRPGFGGFNLTSLLPLTAALAYAVVQITTRKMGEKEKASTMVFYVQINLLVISSLFGLFFGNGHFADETNPTLYYLLRSWTLPSLQDYLIMFTIGIGSGAGAYFVSQAYRVAKAGLIAPFEYTALPLSIFWSITIFGDWPDFNTWLGIVLIAGAGLFVVFSEIMQGRRNVLSRPMPRNR
jgi:drug/metabolite transporter (DMT)-like permease